MPSTCVLVLGMHRSGTSALTRCLNLLGMDLGSHLIAPEAMNSKGFWEHADAVHINNQLLHSFGMYWRSLSPLPADWLSSEAAAQAREQIARLIERDFLGVPLWGIKDPRMCRLAPLWIEVLKSLDVETKAVITLRSPLEVAASLKKAHAQLTDEQLNIFSWVQHVAESEVATRGLVRMLVEYDDLMVDPEDVLQDIGSSLNIDWPMFVHDRYQAIHAFLDNGLRTHVRAEKELPAPTFARRIVDASKAIIKNKVDDWSALSAISDEVMESTRLIGTLERMYLHKSDQSARAVFYFAKGDAPFQETDAKFGNVPFGRSQLNFELPGGSTKALRFRLDPIDRPSCCLLRSLVVRDGSDKVIWDYADSPENVELLGVQILPSFTQDGVNFLVTNQDPQILFTLPTIFSLDGAQLHVDIERLPDSALSNQLIAADALRNEHLQAEKERISANTERVNQLEWSLQNMHVELQATIKRTSELEELERKAFQMELTIQTIQGRLDVQDAKTQDVAVSLSVLDRLNLQVQALTEEIHERKNWLAHMLPLIKK